MQSTQSYRVNEPTVIQEIIDGEAIIADLGQGFYYSLDAVGSKVWGALVSGSTVGAIIEAFASHFSAGREEVAAGITQLVERLAEEQLIVPAGNEGSAERGLKRLLETYEGEFSPPVLSKYTDMEQLLLLDPIHEMDETGWPNVPASKAQD
jgi:Coenzyme PQQ synthesis protein D (PqqD)